MQTGGGYIKLFRKARENFLYRENRPHTRREAWEDLLLMVNHSDQDVLVGDQKIYCGRGQSIRSLDSWAKEFNWSKSKVKRFFDMLKRESMIVTENVQKTTRITICNYDTYQGDRNDDETTMKRCRPTNKNEKNDNKDNAQKTSFLPDGNRGVKKGKAKTVFQPPSFDEVKEYSSKRGRQDLSKQFFDYYDAGDWHDKDGKPVKNWKQKFITWENRNAKSDQSQDQPRKSTKELWN
jgi:hypothetical protein